MVQNRDIQPAPAKKLSAGFSAFRDRIFHLPICLRIVGGGGGGGGNDEWIILFLCYLSVYDKTETMLLVAQKKRNTNSARELTRLAFLLTQLAFSLLDRTSS